MKPPSDGNYTAEAVANLLNEEAKSSILAALSKRDRAMFDLLIQGVSPMGIAVRMGIEARSVSQARYRIRQKLGAHDLLAFAREHGLKA